MGQTTIANRNEFAAPDLHVSEVPMGTEDLQDIYLNRWRFEFLFDRGSAEIVFGAVRKLQRGDKLTFDDAGVSRKEFPSIRAHRTQSLRELTLLNDSNPAVLGSIAIEASVYNMEYERQRREEERRIEEEELRLDNEYATADFHLEYS